MRRLLLALVIIAVATTGLVVGVRVAVRALTDRVTSGCTFGPFDTSTDQAATASSMVGVVTRRRLPRRAAVLVLAAGLQESKLRNIAAGQGDRDSVGVLQQRPSQGWGSATELADVRFATGAFLDRLVKVAAWRTDDLATVIQAVQVSANGDLYARHEEQATVMTDALSGQTARGVSCRFPAPDQVATAAQVATQVRGDLGLATPGTRGRTVTATGAGWATAAWFVANADRLGIDSVDFSGGRWRRGQDWQDRSASGTGAVVATLAG